MRLTSSLTVTLSCALVATAAAEPCPPAPALSCPYEVVSDTFRNEERHRTCYLFRPDRDTISPLFIFCPAYSADDPDEYEELLLHFAAEGNHLLYVPEGRVSLNRKRLRNYDPGIDDIASAVHRWNFADTSRIAVIGHGFGGGAAPAIMKALRNRSWGERGALLYIMSPWYLCGIDGRSLRAFPDDIRCVIQIFDDDRLNDPKIAVDIAAMLGISSYWRVFLKIRSIDRENCRIRADFYAPGGNRSALDEWNILDVCGILHPIDVAASHAFSSDTLPLSKVLGESIAKDRNACPGLPEFLSIIDTPSQHIPRGIWVNMWNSIRNPRIDENAFRKARKANIIGRMRKIAQLARHIVLKFRAEKKAELRSKEDTEAEEENPIKNGYGSNGPFRTLEERFAQVSGTGDSVSVFLPDMPGRPPVIFFLHGYNNGKTAFYSQLLRHIASKGYALIFSPYPTLPPVNDERAVMEKYEISYGGFDEAVRRYAERIDTTRIGIFGQSLGAGAVPWTATRLITRRGMGKNGAFLFISAPWYLFGVSDNDLREIGGNIKMLIMVYDDDMFNDHQMAVDLFTAVSIPPGEKSFVTLFSDTLDSVVMSANHYVPYGPQSIYGVIDNLDYYGIFRHFDALAAYAFTGDSVAKDIALGAESPERCSMGSWPDGTPVTPLSTTTRPKALHPSLQYMFSWNNRLNPRRSSIRSQLDSRLKRTRQEP